MPVGQTGQPYGIAAKRQEASAKGEAQSTAGGDARVPSEPRKPRLLDQVRETIRRKHYSIRTEEAYVDWIKRYIFFHEKQHPAEMGEAEIRSFYL